MTSESRNLTGSRASSTRCGRTRPRIRRKAQPTPRWRGHEGDRVRPARKRRREHHIDAARRLGPPEEEAGTSCKSSTQTAGIVGLGRGQALLDTFISTSPARISTAAAIRMGLAASPSTMTPTRKAPTAPMPVQTV